MLSVWHDSRLRAASAAAADAHHPPVAGGWPYGTSGVEGAPAVALNATAGRKRRRAPNMRAPVMYETAEGLVALGGSLVEEQSEWVPK